MSENQDGWDQVLETAANSLDAVNRNDAEGLRRCAEETIGGIQKGVERLQEKLRKLYSSPKPDDPEIALRQAALERMMTE